MMRKRHRRKQINRRNRVLPVHGLCTGCAHESQLGERHQRLTQLRAALTFFICKGGGYRTFNVAKPIIARISEMIQKRITIVLSAQPFFS